MLLTVTILLLLCLLAFGVYASMSISSGVYLKVFCKGDSGDKSIALTFDDGPDAEQTPKVLEILRKYDVKAAFFCIGSKAEQNPEVIRQMVAEGHLVGNHTFEHTPIFPLFCRVEMEDDLRKSQEVLSRITGKNIKLFRPPFGVTNPTVGSVVRKLGYKTVGWSIRSFDTVKKFSREQVLARVEAKLHNGGIILLHDDRVNSEWLVEAVIQRSLSKGYKFKRVDELFNKK